ncbi:Cat operon transcriptional regulator [Hydrogenophaga sp. T4]|nr:Cat operon transcriptional regulator [Hydrogenophaga sp. T4]
MNFRQLKYFCEVVRCGTLTRAAEQLHVAPTAISMQISQLEAELGGELFNRNAKPMALTPLGLFFLPRAREVLSQGLRLEQDAKDLASGKSGWLGVGFVRSMIYSVLPDAIRSFRERHPEVKLELVELLSERQPEHLRNGRIHIGLSRLEQAQDPPTGLCQTTLFEDAFVAAIPAHHSLADQPSVTLAQLSGLQMISFPKDPSSTYAMHVQSTLKKAGAVIQVGHEAIEIHTALGLVAAGLGFAIVGASVSHRPQGCGLSTAGRSSFLYDGCGCYPRERKQSACGIHDGNPHRIFTCAAMAVVMKSLENQNLPEGK